MKSVVILGLARQGKALARFFAGLGLPVVVSDRRSPGTLSEELEALSDCEIAYVLGDHPLSLLDDARLLCLSGGVPADLPLVLEARRRGIPVSNDAQEFLRRCPAPVIGITGSAGKTTTTSLVGAMLRETGLTTWVGGNIGNPLLNDLDAIRAEDRVVMELSSFQLEIMDVSPPVAAVLNVTPNHLDRHKTLEAYAAAKGQILAHQRREDVAVLGHDDPGARALAALTPAELRFFSVQVEVEEGAFLREDALILRRAGVETEVCRRSDLRLRGAHNVQNALAAIVLGAAGGASVEAMRRAIAAFKGVTHRLEEVRAHQGVLWVNDSIATAPERTLAALEAFTEPVVLLAGGRDKDLPWEDFARRVTERVRVLVLFGEATALIEAQVREHGQGEGLKEIVRAGTLEHAVAAAAERARPGEVVLLSPGGTSFDAYQDFAARGEHFRQLVAAL